MTKNTILKGGAGLAAAVALAVGGVAISSGSSNSSNAATAARPHGAPPAGAPGFGAPVTGTAAAKAKAAALAKYHGTIERVTKAPNGSGYQVHVIRADGSEVHVLVSASYQVTGTQAGGPPQGARPQQQPATSGSTT